jgi:hypothetical protein
MRVPDPSTFLSTVAARRFESSNQYSMHTPLYGYKYGLKAKGIKPHLLSFHLPQFSPKPFSDLDHG